MPDGMLVVLGALAVIGLGVVMMVGLFVFLLVMDKREAAQKAARKAPDA